MNAVLVSVVVPAYNAGLYLKQALESLLAQTFRSFEIIVVDDGSTDDTALVTRQVGNSIRYVYQSNRGLAAARNTGIRSSRGEIIALLDADDLWEPQFLEVMTSLLDEYPRAGAAYCGFQYIDEQGQVVGKPSLKVVPPEEFHKVLITDGNWLSACGVIFRKRLAQEVGLFDESLRAVEDEDLWIRLSARFPFVGVPRALVKYRRHDGNMSSEAERMVTAMLQAREKNFGPVDGDADTWPELKVFAYRNAFQFAAIKYFAFGDVKRSADFIEQFGGLSWDHACSLSLWRGLVRAQLPEVDQFEPLVKLDWTVAESQLTALLEELARRTPSSDALRGRFATVKGSAYLAMADEAGRGREFQRAIGWLLRAVRANFRMICARRFWGTIARVLFLYDVRSCAR